MNEEFKIKAYDYSFRIRKFNALELFAIRTQIDFENFESSLSACELILENIEVCFDNSSTWLKVKDGNEYYPSGIENNYEAVHELIQTFLKKFREVFTKSNALND